jgi:hypothetical protein
MSGLGIIVSLRAAPLRVSWLPCGPFAAERMLTT